MRPRDGPRVSQAGPLGAYFPALYPVEVRTLGTGFCFNVGRGIAALSPYTLGALAGHLGPSRSIALCGLGYLAAGLWMMLLPERPPHEEGMEVIA